MHTARELSQSTSSFMTQTRNSPKTQRRRPLRGNNLVPDAYMLQRQLGYIQNNSPPKTRGRCYHPEQPAHLKGQACRLTATILAYNSAQQLRGGHTHYYADQTHVRALRQPHARAQDNTAERAQNNKFAILMAHHRCIEGS